MCILMIVIVLMMDPNDCENKHILILIVKHGLHKNGATQFPYEHGHYMESIVCCSSKSFS